MSRCPHCQHENPGDSKFCLECGRRLSLSCGACGTGLPAGAKFCKECGQAVGAATLAPLAGPTMVPPTEPPSFEAERRHLTVLFCDLVDSTPLARRLDPEDYREVIRAYQATCAEVIGRFEGHVAQYLGDGLLSYFGYPQAHEDDARRAVQAGLAMCEALTPLAARLATNQGIRLAVRLGIHTGLVVVGAVGTGRRQETLALGDTPNVAARLQGLAAPNTIVVSDATWHLVRSDFSGDDLGPQSLKGVETPIRAYRLLGMNGAARSRLDPVTMRILTPLVGREEEMALLRARWAQAKDGLGQVVVLSGEAGIGKSRLLQGLYEHVAPEPHVRVEWHCSPYAQQSPLHPVIAHMHRLLRWRADTAPGEKLRALEETLRAYGFPLPEVVPLLAGLLSLSLPEHYPPLTLTPQRQRQKTLETLLTWLFAEAARQPVLFIVEDLHWVDPSTLELLTLLVDQGPAARLLTLFTCRPEFAVPWGLRAHLTPLSLSRLPQPQVAQMVGRVAGGKVLPVEVVAQIVEKTDGVPLFVEELTKTVLESGLLQEREGHYDLTGPVPTLAIPATLHDSLMARLDRLATVKQIAQMGATIGRTFPYNLLRAVASLEEAPLQQGLRQLVQTELVYQRGLPPEATYTFKHALIQDAAYQSLLRSTRQQVHQRIAQVLEAQLPEIPASQPELLAHHLTEAGLPAQAVLYWQKAGQRALDRSAYAEAIGHLSRGIQVLTELPATRIRHQQELSLQLSLAQALHASKGQAAPQVERAYGRARELCEHLEDPPQLFRVLLGLYRFYGGRLHYQTALELTEQLHRLALDAQDPDLLLQAHMARGTMLLLLGEFVGARRHLEEAIVVYDPEHHRGDAARHTVDPGVISSSRMSWVLWLLGFPSQALEQSQVTLALAKEVAHAYSLANSRHFAAMLHQFRREPAATQALAEITVTLATELGMAPRLAAGMFMRGWAQMASGQEDEGVAEMDRSLRAFRATGTLLDLPWYLGVLAEARGRAGGVDEGHSLVVEALELAGGTYFCTAELHRIRGELFLRQAEPDVIEAEGCFQEALRIARGQQGKAWELRAAVSLARLWQQQGKRAQAHELLAPIYGWFAEGIETADLQEAKALVEALQ